MSRHFDVLEPPLALLLAVAVALALIAACAGPIPSSSLAPTISIEPVATSASDPDYWPTSDWRTSPPEKQKVDGARLDAMYAAIAENQLNVQGVLIVRNGYVVAERYYPPFNATTRHVQFSVTKSFVSTLVGIAADRGRIPGVQAKVTDLTGQSAFAAADANKRALTLDDLLTMRSGLGWREGDEMIYQMANGRDWSRFVLDLPMTEAPGSRFNYCTDCSHVLSVIVQRAMGKRTQDFAREALLGPLGITNYQWETDTQGLAIGGWGLWLTPRDMAKLGYLYLNSGRWGDRQIVSADWVARATEARTDAGEGWGYGYQWWINPRLGAYFARGRNAQIICVVPEKSLVAVFTADLPDDRPIVKLIEEYVVPAAEAE